MIAGLWRCAAARPHTPAGLLGGVPPPHRRRTDGNWSHPCTRNGDPKQLITTVGGALAPPTASRAPAVPLSTGRRGRGVVAQRVAGEYHWVGLMRLHQVRGRGSGRCETTRTLRCCTGTRRPAPGSGDEDPPAAAGLPVVWRERRSPGSSRAAAAPLRGAVGPDRAARGRARAFAWRRAGAPSSRAPAALAAEGSRPHGHRSQRAPAPTREAEWLVAGVIVP